MQDQDPLRPQAPGGLGKGAMLAIAVHLALLLALAVGVNWRSTEPEGVSAELWSAVPQQAAPRAETPPPQPEPPPPKPAPKPEPKPVVKAPEPEPVKRDAQIAVEQERKAKLEKERLEREREREKAEREKKEKLAQAEKEKAEQKRKEAEAKRREAAEEKRMAEVLEKQREAQLQRMQGMVGATGGPTATGSAQRDAGPSAGYAGRIKARIKPNIVFPDDLPSNPTAEVQVQAGPDGTILGRRLVKSSGVKEWDDAVLRAIDRTEVLPRDVDGRVPSSLVISFRPRE